MIVVLPPGFQFLAGVSKASEDGLVETFIAKPCIEAFDKAVLIRLARCDVVPLDIAFLRPAQDRHASQFGAVVADDGVRPRHALEDRCIELTPTLAPEIEVSAIRRTHSRL